MLNRDRGERAQTLMRTQGIDAYLIPTHDVHLLLRGGPHGAHNGQAHRSSGMATATITISKGRPTLQ